MMSGTLRAIDALPCRRRQRGMFMVRRGFAKGRLKDYGQTTGSRRAVPLRARVVVALERLPHRRRILFPAREGGRMDINNWRSRSWTPSLAAAGIQPRRIYDVRHTYASWEPGGRRRHLRAGPPDGHEREVIDQTYGHLITGADVRERELLDAFDQGAAVSLGT